MLTNPQKQFKDTIFYNIVLLIKTVFICKDKS